MRRGAVVTLAVIGAIGTAVLIWHIFLPGDKARIVRTLDRAADAVAIKEGEPPVAPVKMHTLEMLLDDRIEYSLRFDRREYSGSLERREVLAHLTALRKSGLKLDLKLSGHAVSIDGDTALAEAEASITGVSGRGSFSLQEDMEIHLVRRGGEWLITRIRCRSFMEK
jgi:hypothetical protein